MKRPSSRGGTSEGLLGDQGGEEGGLLQGAGDQGRYP